MEFINNRYRIIKELDERSSYICSDMWDGDKLLKLSIIDQNTMTSKLKDYYINEFIGISELENDYIVKNYSFDIVSEIDNKINLEKQYFYISNYIRKSKSLLEYISDKGIFEIMDIFKEICKTVHYLHIKGYVYGAINLNNIFIVKEGQKDCLKFKDIATVRLEQETFDKNDMKSICFELCEATNIGPSDIRYDMYSVGVLLLSMITKKICKSSPKELINLLITSLSSGDTDYSKSEVNFLLKLMPIIQKLLSIEKEYPYRYLYEFVDEINEKTRKEYYIVDKENLQKLNLYTKLIGREDIVNKITMSYESMVDYRSDKKVYFIEGNSGIGKTRLLKELKFLLRLKGADIHSSFKLNYLNDDKEMWEDIFNKLILNADKDLVKRYRRDLREIMPEVPDFRSIGAIESFNESSNKYKLLNRIAKFIVDSLKDRPSVIIIDNIHLANEFTIDILKYLYSEIKNDKNIMLIFSYKENKMEINKNFLEFKQNLQGNNNSYSFKLDNLNLDESGEMIKNILTMDHVPRMLNEKIYSKAYGNPLFITEIIKELYTNKRIFILQRSGLWHIDLPKGDVDYKELHIPNNLEQVLLNQLKGISKEEYMVMNSISIVFNPITLDDLSGLLDMEREALKLNISSLINKGFLYREYRDYKEVYAISNKVLNDIIYDRISDGIKIEIHKKIVKITEKRMEAGRAIDLDELIYHLERTGDTSKLKKYLVKNSKEKYKSRKTKAAIENLVRAINYLEDKEISQMIELNLRKAEMLLEIESIFECMKTLEKIEELASSLGDIKTKLKVYILKLEIYILKGDDINIYDYLDKTEALLEQVYDLESFLWYKTYKAILLLREGRTQQAIEICNKVIELAGKDFIKTRGHIYRLLALAYTNLNQFEKAIELNKKSIELLESIGYIRGVLYALNNIGSIYHDNYQDLDKALKYYKKNIEISREYNILSGELMSLINTGALLYDKHEYTSAFKYSEEALKKAVDSNYKEESIFLYRMLTTLSLDMGDFSTAYNYYQLSVENSGEDKHLLDEVKLIRSHLYMAFGDFDRALTYTKESLDYLKDIKSTVRYKFAIRHCLLKIIVGETKDYGGFIDEIIGEAGKIQLPEQRIVELSNVVQVLYRKKDYNNAQRVFKVLEKSVDKGINDEARSSYYYIRGIMSSVMESLECFTKALKIAKKKGNKLLQSHIKIEMGNYYSDKDDYYNAISAYIAAAEIIRNIIYDIPDPYKLNFVNNYGYGTLFKRIRSLKKLLLENGRVQEPLDLKDEKLRIKSLQELSDILSEDYNSFAADKDFMDRYTRNYRDSFKIMIFDEKSIIDNLDNNIINNINLVLQYLSAASLSTSIAVVVEEQNSDLVTIASMGEENNIKGNRYIFDRLRNSMEPILLSNREVLNEYDSNFLQGDLKASAYIPIAGGYSKYYLNKGKKSLRKHVPKIQGYLYLETSNTINDFSQARFNENLGLINLIAILCEKYILRKIATIDKLTGALTRKYLEDGMAELVKTAKANNEEFSIIMYDLDRFKRVNDKFGHQTGDEVLKNVSQLVMDNIDKKCSLGRYGGEEFVVILPDTGTLEALKVANELREKIYQGKILGDMSPVSISGGVATYPAHGSTPHQLIEKADQALYSAKENGRNRCEVWNKNIIDKTKPISKLDGIITGDEVRDARNILAIIETTELINSNLSREDIIAEYLSRILETLEGEYGYLILVEDGKIGKKYEKKARQEEGLSNLNFNKEIIEDVIQTKQGIYMIDWDYVRKDSLMAGLPVWNSILAVPILQEDQVRAVIYLIVSTKSKEFGKNDLNFTNVYSNLLHL